MTALNKENHIEIFPWNTNFETGIPIIDEQHKKLIDLLNLLISHIAYQSDVPTLNLIFDELKEYTQYHFSTEEKIWQDYFYDDTWGEWHKHAHTDFISEVIKIKEESHQSLDETIEEIVKFLTHWLAFHILDSDKRMAKVVLALPSGMSLTQAKIRADEEMSGSTRILIETIMGMYDQLANRTVQMTKEINKRKEVEAELQLAKEKAEAANIAKSTFISTMSHELRTPLNAILGFAQLLSRNNTVPEAAQNDVQTIIRCGQQLLSLINDVLEISSIETGHLKTRFDVINLPNLLSSLVETLQITNRNVWLHFEPAPNLPEFIETDFGKLRRMLQNLLGNAVKFTHQGSITLQVYIHLENAQEMLCVAVNDTGIGIEEKDKEFLFKPFFQSQYGMNLGVGTGLGLYISQEYAKLLGGQITVDSQSNVGSTFLVTLPLIRAKEIEKVVQHKGDVLGLAAGQSTKRILVVDDQPENQHLISELLKQVGFQVSIAANGMQAVQSFQKWKPHFIYMDMRMPEMNGIEATRIIRAMSGGNHVPIIALTASLLEENHPDILEAGCNAVLRKPVEPSVLFETIATYLNLEFEYGNRPPSQPVIEKELAFFDLSVLPNETRQQLYHAAIGLDTELIDVIINELETDYPDVALYLKQLEEEFQFDFISSLTAPTKS
jgi:hemerythrin-like metal-binding protein